MGSSDNFCLRWNDFESNISTSFRELREDSEFLDVTLCCDNGVDVVQAHKVILAACSPLFRKILSRQKSQGQNPFLYLKGIRLKELRAVLDFIYHGEVNVAQDSLNNFLAVAEELAIKGLTTDSQKPGGGSGGGDPPNSEQRKKAVAKRKSVPQSSSAPVQIPVQAKKPKTDDDVEGIIEDVDVKGIKAEPEPSGSGVAAPNVPMVEAELDDSYGAGADDDNGDFGGGEEFEGFDQYGDGNDFDDSLGAAGASASAGADGKGRAGISADLISMLQNPQQIQQLPKRSFPLDYKLQIVEESKLSSVHAVAKAHGITGKCIQRWRKQEDQLREALVSGRMYNSGGHNRKPPSAKKKSDSSMMINDPGSSSDTNTQ